MIDFDAAPDSSDFDFDPPPVSGKGAAPISVSSAYLDALNDKQREAVLATEGPLIVLAGAGSGKTKMLTSRIAYLIENRRVPAHQILAVTFTNKAAGEMRERVEKTLNLAHGQYKAQPVWMTRGPQLGAPEIGTFHSVCMRLLRREMDRTPFTKPYVIYDDGDQLSLIKGIVNKMGLDDKIVNPKAVQGSINRLKCDAIEPAEMEPAPHNIFERHLKRVYEEYQKELFANNALDFGEIITLAYKILRDNPDVRAKYQKRWRYLHVDEYQDTNRAQYLLLSQLTMERFGGHQNICVVGDEDQSIYKWRGADINNILDFEKDYPGAHVVKLEQNYRSTQTIIKAAGHVIKNNRTRKDKTLWTDNEVGIPIVRAQLPDERAEAEVAISEIKRIAASDERAYGDFAIFYRTNAQSRSFEDVLRREKIPYQIVGGLRFYDRKEIKDILAYFKVILNPTDSINLKRIVNVPARGIGKTTLDKIEEYHLGLQRGGVPEGSLGLEATEGTTYWDALRRVAHDSSGSVVSAGTSKKLLAFVKLLERLMEEQPKLMLSELYHLILDETGYVRELRAEGTEESMARIENLEEFDNLLKEFEEDQMEDYARMAAESAASQSAAPVSEESELSARKASLLPVFIEQSSLASDADQKDSAAAARDGGSVSAVRMMTLHSSKGLEFPVVFLVGLEEGLFPSVRQWEEEQEEDVEEERRLCYVGMTRAREQLYMLNVAIRRQWGEVKFQEPSRFFDEIPAEFIQMKDFGGGGGSQSVGRSQFRVGSSRQFGWGGGSDDYSSSSSSRSRAPSISSGTAVKNGVLGRSLTHPEYGPGKITHSEGTGEDQKVTIEFRDRSAGTRKFLFRYVACFLD